MAASSREMDLACIRYRSGGVPCRVYADFRYRTLPSWSRERRVVAKAEYLPGGPNPRCVTTALADTERPGPAVYARDYCSRGDTENRIKEQKLDLAAGRTSTSQLRANQLRLWFSAIA